MVDLPLADRQTAGKLLGRALITRIQTGPNTLVLGLVRGGAMVAKHLADTLTVSWDIILVSKLGSPIQPEYALGAYVESGQAIVNRPALMELGLDDDWIELAKLRAREKQDRLHHELRGNRSRPQLQGRDLILCDDGIATGYTMRAAIDAALLADPASLILAVPVLPPNALRQFTGMGIKICYLACPRQFHAVGQFYRDFTPVDTRDIQQLLLTRKA